MALRVLLADESVTIKKVFQLALQDYGVEVNNVHLGTDVLEIAKEFKPDIVFADVLLQKKNGFDVAKEIKSTPEMSKTPVVLIWSNFLELDEEKFKDSGAEEHLEKPFDTDRLRQLVKSLVPKTQDQSISDFLDFPKMPDFEGEKEVSVPPAPPILATPPEPSAESSSPPDLTPTSASATTEKESAWSMDDFDNLNAPAEEEFVQLDLESKPSISSKTSNTTNLDDENNGQEDEQWTRASLDKFRVSPEKMDPTQDVIITPPVTPQANPNPADFANQGTPQIHISEEELKKLVRTEAMKLIEKVVWEVVPELATQIIERELNQILHENNEQS